MAPAVLTIEDLRAELKTFAESAVRHELAALKDSLLNELRDTKDSFINQTEDAELKPSSVKPSSVKPSSVNATGDETEAAARPSAKLQKEGLHQAMAMALREGETSSDQGAATRKSGKMGGHGRKSLRNVERVHKEEDGSLWGRMQAVAQECVLSHNFENLTIGAVLLNAGWIGFQTDWTARSWSDHPPIYFRAVDGAFCAASLIEVVIRIVAEGWPFFYGPGRKWNWFDFLVVITQCTDMSIQVFSKGGDHSQLQGLRLIKMVRIMRIARIATVFPELHVLITSIMDSMHSLFWTMLLVVAVLYAMAIVITQMVTEHAIKVGIDEMEENEEFILEHFGTLDSSIISLFMIISEGAHWSELMEPLAEHVNPAFKYMIVVFVAFQLFAMMNIITACFVDNAMKIAAKAESDEVLDSLSDAISNSMGSSDYKILTAEAFQAHADEPGMVRFMEFIGAGGEDPAGIFAVIDAKGDGVLSHQDFVAQCEKVIGPAKAMSMYKMEHELKEGLRAQGYDMNKIFEAQQLQHKMVLDMFSKVLERTAQMQNLLTSKIPGSSDPPGSPKEEGKFFS